MAQTDKPVIVTLSCEAAPSTETEEIDRAEWEAMTPGQRLALLDTLADTHVANAGGYGWWIDDEADASSVGDPGNLPPDPLRELAEWLASQSQSTATVATAVDAIARARVALGRTEGS